MIIKEKGTQKKPKWRDSVICLFSLNHEKRRRELLRVARENSTMIKRINERKPDTKQEDWEKNWSQNAAYLDNIAKYELGWHTSKVSHKVSLLTLLSLTLH